MEQSKESITLMTPSRFPHHGSRFFAIALGNVFRSSSSCRFLFPIDNDALSQNRHSERRQEYCGRKTGNGMVTQSEEAITLMTFYRLIQGSYRKRIFSYQLTAHS